MCDLQVWPIINWPLRKILILYFYDGNRTQKLSAIWQIRNRWHGIGWHGGYLYIIFSSETESVWLVVTTVQYSTMSMNSNWFVDGNKYCSQIKFKTANQSMHGQFKVDVTQRMFLALFKNYSPKASYRWLSGNWKTETKSRFLFTI
jgi:hypothetical protein